MGEPGKRPGWRFWPWVGILLIAYLLPFAVWVLDGMFYDGSHYQSLGRGTHHLFQTVYWPLLEIIRMLFGRAAGN